MRFNPDARYARHQGCSEADFETLKAALAEITAELGSEVYNRHLAAVQAEGKSQHPVRRTRWDAYWMARKRFPVCQKTGSPGAFCDALDAHIETALHRLLPA